MTYVLLGQARLGDGLLFVLWTRAEVGVRVLPIGSRDRRAMQVVGRQLMDSATPWRGDDGALEHIVAAIRAHVGGQPVRFVALGARERKAIEWSIARGLDLIDRDGTLPDVRITSDLLTTPGSAHTYAPSDDGPAGT